MMRPMFDVIIVGAGIAGLHTAWRLQQRGQSVLVLEARERIGGRLLSHPVADAAPIDLGATWIWPAERRVTALARELGLDHVRTELETLTKQFGKRFSPSKFLREEI